MRATENSIPDQHPPRLSTGGMMRGTASVALLRVVEAVAGLIIVPFPDTDDTAEMVFGIGKKVGDKITVMYYVSGKADAGNAISMTYELSPDTMLHVRQNSDDSISGGVSHQITFN